MMDPSQVSLSELFEVRTEGGFESDEILALLAAASSHLAASKSAGVFNAESFFISSEGMVSIKFLPLKSIPHEAIPPELHKIDESAKETDIGMAQMVS